MYYNECEKGGAVMRKMHSKIPAIIAMLITIASFVLFAIAFSIFQSEIEPESGVSKSFALAILGLLTAVCSSIFYLIDAFISIAKVSMKINPAFNLILAIVIFATPLVGLVTRILPDITIALWFAIIFVLEIISVIQHIKMMFANGTTQNS